MIGAILALTCQWIEPRPGHADVGTPIRIEARARAGPIEGLAIRVRRPDGSVTEVGSTDAVGDLGFVPDAPGSYEFEADLPGRGGLLVAPFYARLPQRRWLYAAIGTPAGLLLLLWHVRRRRGPRTA